MGGYIFYLFYKGVREYKRVGESGRGVFLLDTRKERDLNGGSEGARLLESALKWRTKLAIAMVYIW